MVYSLKSPTCFTLVMCACLVFVCNWNLLNSPENKAKLANFIPHFPCAPVNQTHKSYLWSGSGIERGRGQTQLKTLHPDKDARKLVAAFPISWNWRLIYDLRSFELSLLPWLVTCKTTNPFWRNARNVNTNIKYPF